MAKRIKSKQIRRFGMKEKTKSRNRFSPPKDFRPTNDILELLKKSKDNQKTRFGTKEKIRHFTRFPSIKRNTAYNLSNQSKQHNKKRTLKDFEGAKNLIYFSKTARAMV